MIRRWLIILAFTSLCSLAPVKAQNVVIESGSTQISGDTIVQTEKGNNKSHKAKKPHSAKKATIMSACLPGLGQVYNGKWWKVPIVYAGLGGLGYMAYSNYSQYGSYLHAYEFKTGDLPEGVTLSEHETELANRYTESQLQTYKESYRRNFELFSIITVAWYGLNIVDACVDGHLYNYDISDELGFSIDPYAPVGNDFVGLPPVLAQAGLSFKLNFK